MSTPTHARLADLLKQTLKEFGQDECTRQAAALSFFTVFSLPALLVVVVGVLSLVFGPEGASDDLMQQLSDVVGPDVAAQLNTMVTEKAGKSAGKAGVAAAISMLVMVFGATGVFVQIQVALNKAWGVAPAPKQGIKNFVAKRARGFAMIVAGSVLLLASLLATAAIGAFGDRLFSGLPGGLAVLLLTAMDLVVTVAALTLLFAAVYKLLPDAQIAWRDVWFGAFATTVLVAIGKVGIGFYLAQTDPGSAFGAAGSLAVLLVWINLTSLIFFFGAELTQVWAQRNGKEILPSPGAVKVVYETRFPDDATP